MGREALDFKAKAEGLAAELHVAHTKQSALQGESGPETSCRFSVQGFRRCSGIARSFRRHWMRRCNAAPSWAWQSTRRLQLSSRPEMLEGI